MPAGYKLFSVGYNRVTNGCYYSGFILPTGTYGTVSKDARRRQYRMVVHTKGLKIHSIKFTKVTTDNFWCTDRPPNVLEGLRPITLEKLFYQFPQIEEEVNMFALAQTLRDK